MNLDGGYLIYKIRCPRLHADNWLAGVNNSRLNDGNWHRVDYRVSYFFNRSVRLGTFDNVKL